MAHALGARVTYAGVVGDDAAGERLRRHLAELGLSDAAVLTDPTLPTTQKTRIIAKVQQVCRVDYDPAGAVSEPVRDALRQRIASALEDASVLCLEDYHKGLFSPELLQELIALARGKGLPVLLDPWRHGDFSRYRGASLICPNRMEASGAVHRQLDTDADLEAAARQLLRELELEAVLITLGGDGSALLERGGQYRHLPARPRAVFDPTGAGDMTLAALGVAVAAGAPYLEAAQLANVASGLKVEKLGTAVVTRDELLADLAGLNLSTRAKVLPRDQLAKVLNENRRRGETIVFTNGCFDLLHPGHLELLRVASLQGDVLVVALNSDASVRGLKGPGRPLLGEEARTQMVAALEMVDYVTLFSEPTPLATIQLLRPDVLVKGEDWQEKGVVGREFVESYGGRVVLVPVTPGYSTTGMLEQIRQAKDPKK
jgi:D-beta-D-heptose 7-phosphate kinase/D-beta-D-heptose 1-phosphate adenosyltransferase